jgi:hypothetical protein
VVKATDRTGHAVLRNFLNYVATGIIARRVAEDADATIIQARLLHGLVDRANVLIKIPATAEGLAAITETLGSGISVNVTLIFSIERYAQVLDAWMSGLEKAHSQGRDLSAIESVASFFVSRMDTEVDARLAVDAQRFRRARVLERQVLDVLSQDAEARADGLARVRLAVLRGGAVGGFGGRSGVGHEAKSWWVRPIGPGMRRGGYHAGTLRRNVGRRSGGALRLASPYISP